MSKKRKKTEVPKQIYDSKKIVPLRVFRESGEEIKSDFSLANKESKLVGKRLFPIFEKGKATKNFKVRIIGEFPENWFYATKENKLLSPMEHTLVWVKSITCPAPHLMAVSKKILERE